MVKMIPWMLAALAVAFGAVLVYYGQVDDSPGLGGIGLIIMLLAVIWAVRRFLRLRRGGEGR